MRPRAVIWDIGNVMVRWDPRTLYSKIFPDPAERERFLTSVCTMDWHLAHDLGVTFAENRAPLLERHPEYADEIHAWEDRWWEMFSGAIPETEAAIEVLNAAGHKRLCERSARLQQELADLRPGEMVGLCP